MKSIFLSPTLHLQKNLSGWVLQLISKPQATIDYPPKFYVAPESKPSQKESNLPTIIFQGLC